MFIDEEVGFYREVLMEVFSTTKKDCKTNDVLRCYSKPCVFFKNRKMI